MKRLLRRGSESVSVPVRKDLHWHSAPAVSLTMQFVSFGSARRGLLQRIGISVSLSWLMCLCIFVGCGTSSEDVSQSPKSAETLQRVTEKGPVKLTIRITPAEPRLSDLVDMEVQVDAEAEVEIRPPAFGTAVGDFLVRDYSETTGKEATSDSGSTPASDNKIVSRKIRTFRYQLEPVHSGTHLIRSLAIEFVDNRESSESGGQIALIESEPIEVKVTSELDDEVPDLARLEPMLPPQPIEERTSIWWIVAAAVSVSAAAIAAMTRRQRRSRPIIIPEKTPEETAQAALEQLLGENLPAQGLFKEFYVRLTGIVRVYIEGRTGLRAPEQTTEEFLRDMRKSNAFAVDRSVRLQEFLEAADMVKYAGQQPGPEQVELSILRAREFIGS